MFLTPPDIISQTLLALPMWLLFEVGIFFSRQMLKRKANASRVRDEIYEAKENKESSQSSAASSKRPASLPSTPDSDELGP